MRIHPPTQFLCTFAAALLAACGEKPATLPPDAGTPTVCTRATQTKTADIALLDKLREDDAKAASQAERDALTAAFFDAVAQQGGTPLRSAESDRVAFIARDAPQTQYSVGASFNGWKAGQDVLTRVGQTNVWAVEKTLPRSEPYAYKMVDGTTWYEDRRAQNVVWDGINRGTVGEFNAVVHPEVQDATKGRLVAWRDFPSAVLGKPRDVFIYVPPAYDDDAACSKTLPTLYFHDGNESLTRAPFTVPADATYAAHPEESALLVFVALASQAERMSQYTFSTQGATGDDYLKFLSDELRPKVEASFRTCKSAVDRGLGGASLGGLISGYGAFTHPETWGYVGSQSGSYFWNNNELITRVTNEGARPVRWYLDHGCPNDNCDENRLLADALTAKGYELRHIEEANAQHDWAYWKNRLPNLLRYFREGRSGCAP